MKAVGTASMYLSSWRMQVIHHMKQKYIYKAFEVTDFLREIDRVLPTIQGEEHRHIVMQTRNLLIAFSSTKFPKFGEMPECAITSEELLMKIIESLRCCGIAPKGWPQPPGPEALIRLSSISVPGWNGIDAEGGRKP